MDNDKLIAVARALMRHHDLDPDVYAGMHGGYGDWLDMARAALDALREQQGWPNSEHCAAAIRVFVRHGLLPKWSDEETYLRTYETMREALIAAAPQSPEEPTP